MEHAKKMLLIEPSLIDKLNKHSNTDNPLSRLDMEMNKILNSNMDDRKKCILYLQILQRYLHFTEEDRQTFELPIVTKNSEFLGDNIKNESHNKNKDSDIKEPVFYETSSDEEKHQAPTATHKSPIYSTKQILRLIPKTYAKKGEQLLNLISLSNNKIQWNDDGTVLIDNEKITGSNILDLINDSLRPLKRSDPIGWEKFAKALKDIKIPITYIGNPKRSEYINHLQLIDLGEHSANEEFSTPSEKYTNKIKKKLDWEKWTPY